MKRDWELRIYGRKAAKQLMQRTNSQPDEIDLVIVATTTPDYRLPSTASILCERLGLKRAFCFRCTGSLQRFLCMHWRREQTLFVRETTRKLSW